MGSVISECPQMFQVCTWTSTWQSQDQNSHSWSVLQEKSLRATGQPQKWNYWYQEAQVRRNWFILFWSQWEDEPHKFSTNWRSWMWAGGLWPRQLHNQCKHTVQEQSDANHVQKAYLNCGPNTLYTSRSSSHSTYIQQNVPLGIKGISFDF